MAWPNTASRFVNGFAALLAAAVVTATVGPAPAADRHAQFVRQVGNELIAAARTGSEETLADVIRRHGDVADIGLYSLGSYHKQLPSSRRGTYFEGVARFMARYLIEQSGSYPIAGIEVYTPSHPVAWGRTVDSRVSLRNGDTYRVSWLVVPRGNALKIRDVSLLSFWLVPFQRKLFEDYIDSKNGNVSALLSALER